MTWTLTTQTPGVAPRHRKARAPHTPTYPTQRPREKTEATAQPRNEARGMRGGGKTTRRGEREGNGGQRRQRPRPKKQRKCDGKTEAQRGDAPAALARHAVPKRRERAGRRRERAPSGGSIATETGAPRPAPASGIHCCGMLGKGAARHRAKERRRSLQPQEEAAAHVAPARRAARRGSSMGSLMHIYAWVRLCYATAPRIYTTGPACHGMAYSGTLDM